MTTKTSELVPISITAGVHPSTDSTPSSTVHYTFSDKIRFVKGLPQKIGGWVSQLYAYSAWPVGVPRTLYSAITTNILQTIIGTHKRLLALQGSQLFNITPLQTTTIAIANSIATDYGTLANNPITTTINSNILTITDSNTSKYVAGDSITLSGSAAVGGILAATINTAHKIKTIGTGNYTIAVGTNATSTATGGGASVVRSTGRITITAASHGMANGDRVKIASAVAAGGVTAPQINLEFAIRNVAAGTFDVYTSGVATSSVSGAGGAATTYQKQLADGFQNESYGQGYGMGKYGNGLYGTALISSTGKRYPRIWAVDRFGNNLIMTAGNQTGLYTWAGVSTTAPTLVSGAPTAINYAFVSDGIAVTYGASNVDNHIFASDQNDITQWVASATNQVFEDYIEGAGRFISHVPVAGQNLIFTPTQTYRMKYIGRPLVWEIELLDNAIGIIAPMARCCVNGVAFWMGQNNFYYWNGANIQIIPSNTIDQSTILRYVFNNLTGAQRSKIFCWYNEPFNEIWWHYPSAGSNECDRVARLNVKDLTWCPDTLERTCAEYPSASTFLPRLMTHDGYLYKHEIGTDSDGSPLEWTLSSPRKTYGKPSALLTGFVPDSLQAGDISVQVATYDRQQSGTPRYDETFTVSQTTELVPIQVGGRWWQYTLSGNVLGQYWRAGNWMEFIQRGAEN